MTAEVPTVLSSRAAALRRSPLAERTADLERASGAGARLAEIPFLTLVDLRVAPGSPGAARLEEALGLRLPGPGRAGEPSGPPGMPQGTARGADTAAAQVEGSPPAALSPRRSASRRQLPAAHSRAALWLGPGEWLIVAPDGAAAEITDRAVTALDGGPGSVVDVSADRTTVALAGPAAREVLEKGMTIDLHPRSFGSGCVAVTTLARARVVLWQVGDEPGYRVLVRASFANYLADWLIDSAAEFRHG